jgi:ATP-dependent helicase/nuclease subunit A
VTSNPLSATNPAHSATVGASAGTGKTWLLVTRLIRLLLAGARPDAILAVTFTRKAAAEMQTRLAARLFELAQGDDESIQGLLREIQAPADDATMQRARQLYEELLRATQPVKATTFHAFCQDILRRFPLEAGVAPGFELLEGGAELQQAAWEALCAEAGALPDGDTAQALETLIETSGGLTSVRSALDGFLAHRSDWWAFSEGRTRPLQFAVDTLSQQLQVDAHSDVVAGFFSQERTAQLREFANLLGKHPTATNQAHAAAIHAALAADPGPDIHFDALATVFLTKEGYGPPRARKESETQRKKMGDANQARFLDLHFALCEAVQAVRDKQAAQHTFQRSTAWYRAGERLLEHYQRLKREQRLLDFADLEWKAYRLLNHGDNAHWIQYKLDQRIDHLLIDEFQDTNPTQWRLILPLLQELAAGGDERRRSVFLVGDDKQSIYGFRRADPELFDTAQTWLQQQLDAVSQPLNTSWRSAQAIMDFVNRLFGEGPLRTRLSHFAPHATHHTELWGRVEILPLVEATPAIESEARSELRNPLQEPRRVVSDQRHLDEGRLIAQRIRDLMVDGIAIGKADAARPIRYSDIMILLRQRTHVADMEQALREAAIPYSGADRGTLLDSLEAQDMVALLEWLVAPFNNLALATVLRSPLFGCQHEDLIALARQRGGDWRERLCQLAPQLPPTSALQRAANLLQGWRQLAGSTPVHDLLDRVFCEGDVLRRYQNAYPAHLRHRVAANLNRFLELALEIDSGRYPSVGHFIARLQSLRQRAQEAPDEGTPTQATDRVRIMTIHASKGLEAPVVFVADSANTTGAAKANQAVLDWPAGESRPTCFLLAGKKEQQAPFTRRLLEHQAMAAAREDANLLYVAVTRARQLLFISGCRPSRGTDLGWYGLIADQYPEAAASPLLHESGNRPPPPAATTTAPATAAVEPSLCQPLSLPVQREVFIAPSRHIVTGAGEFQPATEEDARTRGIAIHRLLQLLCEGATDVKRRVAAELGLAVGDGELGEWVEEAQRVFGEPRFSHLFDAAHYSAAYNEVPLHYRDGRQWVYGIVDRVVVSGDTVWLVDYKTHAVPDQQTALALAERYRPQLAYYARGAQRLWPQQQIRSGLLFTAGRQWLECG